MKIDFHVHTNFSIDSTIKVSGLSQKSKQLGIIPAITDHSTIAANREFRKTGAPFIPGEEIRTDCGDLIGLYLNEEIERKIHFPEAIDRIKEQGGISYLPHMYDTTRYGCGDRYAHLVDIIEIYNARCLDNRINEKAAETAMKLGKPGAAGSDAHFLFEFGKTYNELPDFDIENPKELMKSLEKVKITGKKAPFYVRGPTAVYKTLRKIKKKFRMGKDIK